MKLKIKKLHRDAVTPKYATLGSACFDLAAVDCGQETPIYAGSLTFRTGLAFDIPKDYVMLVFSRSGHGFKNSVRLANCTGVIDSDYVGEVMVRLTNDSHQTSVLRINPGDRIAQAMVIPVERVEFEEVDELKTTERGAGGLGSTGVK